MKKNYLLSIYILLSTIAVSMADSKPDMKFMREAADIVWGDNNDLFDINKDLSDSIYSNSSAIYLAISETLKAHRKFMPIPGDPSRINKENYGETYIDDYTRYMVKINEPIAIDEFSEMEFKARTAEKLGMGYDRISREQAFGARIYKPDGSIVNVDIETALPVTKDKKNNASTYKIAIPNLQKGDILEYFIYDRIYFVCDQSVSKDIYILRKYPIASYSFSGTLDNNLYTTINTFNGLNRDLFETSRDEENTYFKFNASGIEKYDDPKWVLKPRVIPFLRYCITDMQSKLFGGYSRVLTGLGFNPTSPAVMSEIAARYRRRNIPEADFKKAKNLVKDYIKQNSDLDDYSIADAIFLATQYITIESKESYSTWDMAAMFKDIADDMKLQQPVSLGVTTSHDNVSIREIASYDQSTPIVFVGKRPYIFDFNFVYKPGELSGKYHGELAFTMPGKRAEIGPSNDNKATQWLKIDTIPDSKHRDNTEILNIKLNIDTEGEHPLLNVDYTNTMTGARKSTGSAFLTTSDIIELTEEYFNVSGKKKSKRQFDKLAIGDSRRQALECMPEIDFDIEQMKIDSVSILSPGLLPTNDTFAYRIKGSLDNQITVVGDELLVKIGNIVGASAFTTDDKNKERELDICTAGTYNLRHNVTLNIPDGYTVSQESLNDMFVNKSNLCGLYYCEAKYNPEDNTIAISTNFRNNRRIYPAKLWKDFIDLRDAAIAYSDATIVLSPITK